MICEEEVFTPLKRGLFSVANGPSISSTPCIKFHSIFPSLSVLWNQFNIGEFFYFCIEKEVLNANRTMRVLKSDVDHPSVSENPRI